MPVLLFIYLATEILAPFFASLIILNIVLFMGRLVPFLETIFDLRIGVADFFRICAYLAPNLLLFSIPMASMMAVIISFTRLTGDNEILALKAAGVGISRMVMPVAVFALCTAVLTGASSTRLIPEGTVALKRLLFQMAKEKIDRGLQEQQFSESLGDVVLYIDHIDRDSGRWHGVYASDLRLPEKPVTIMATTGAIEPDIANMHLTLTLEEGTMHRSEGEVAQTIRFGRYVLDLPLQAPTMVAGETVNGVDRSALTQNELRREVKRLGPESPLTLGYTIEYHLRLVLPVGCFILTLLGLPMALRSRPGRRPLGLPLGLLAFVVYYVLITAGKSLAEGGALPVVPAMWMPNLIFAALAGLLFRLTALESGGVLVDRLLDGFAAAGRLLSRAKGRDDA